MSSHLSAQLTLAGYAGFGLCLVLWQMFRCPFGWQAWLLYTVNKVYVPMVFHWRANRRCPFPQHGPALVIANHSSPVDPLLIWLNNHLGEKSHLGASYRRMRVINFLTAREYTEMRGLGWICKAMRSIPIDRASKDTGAVREAYRRLKNGELVGVFPEGGINLGRSLRKGNTGAAFLALKANVPVYPVFIHDSPQGKDMIGSFYRFSRTRITYGEPIELSAYQGRRLSRDLLEEVTGLLMRRLAELGGVAYNMPEPDNLPATVPMQRAIV